MPIIGKPISEFKPDRVAKERDRVRTRRQETLTMRCRGFRRSTHVELEDFGAGTVANSVDGFAELADLIDRHRKLTRIHMRAPASTTRVARA
jgi:hypothetical protein